MERTDTAGGAALPAEVADELDRLVDAARRALGEDLQALVLFGSAAEGRLRATSDLNLVFVLRRFEQERIAALQEPLRTARATVGAAPMFLLASELPDAADAFAVKFADLRRRRRVLHGEDPFAGLVVPREAEVRRLRQVVLNQVLRMRERFAVAAPRRGGVPPRAGGDACPERPRGAGAGGEGRRRPRARRGPRGHVPGAGGRPAPAGRGGAGVPVDARGGRSAARPRRAPLVIAP
jgi:predicted nucleotidyltransferase